MLKNTIILVAVIALVIVVIIAARWYFTNKTVRARDIADNPNLPPVTQEEITQGWYRGRVNEKRPGTPPEWIHDGDESLSAAWVRDENTPVLPY